VLYREGSFKCKKECMTSEFHLHEEKKQICLFVHTFNNLVQFFYHRLGLSERNFNIVLLCLRLKIQLLICFSKNKSNFLPFLAFTSRNSLLNHA